MAAEIIRIGDPTSHGGSVVEGSMADICRGKPIAFVGDPIAEAYKDYSGLREGVGSGPRMRPEVIR